MNLETGERDHLNLNRSLRACFKSSGGPLACRRGRHFAARIGARSREEIQVIRASNTGRTFSAGRDARLYVGQDGRRYIFRQSLNHNLFRPVLGGIKIKMKSKIRNPSNGLISMTVEFSLSASQRLCGSISHSKCALLMCESHNSTCSVANSF